MPKTLFDVKNDLVTVGAALAAVKEEKLTEASKPEADIETLKALETKEQGLQVRMDILQKEHDEMEAKQKASLERNKSKLDGVEDPKAKVTAAKAELIRATIRGRQLSEEAKAALGDRNSTGGEKILPTTMTNELLHEPFVKNPLREVSTYTSVTNLEIPKITFTLDDDDFIADTETAKEIKADGDVVSFGRNKFKVFVPISETILAATDTNLVQTVDQGLESGLAAKEKKVAFAKTPKAGEESLSFYGVGIKEVSAENLYKAIKAAVADLHEDYRENAKIVIRYADYMDIIETLANGSATLYNAQPEQILGKPVVFCDSAVDPVVGDLRYSHFNYDPQMIYDRDKDVKTGVELFVLTAWFDHKIKLKSAFRIAKKK
ncbi:phage major capsid protein [Aneurinibacillus aneurinilyticus]|uniref:Phage capsid family protein n=1 Tax=Aneurinibacillus aneurinilyticus ATCC 12856 TaxID=649747 RepID=U1X8M6_ANEAE|nr:phage major capsid protein [Aneurinibacillus aneurinilyticus]ERI10898.1 phage capsid family protein [Aneurinibacillus aneurinilyticus ATCC 12856]MED0704944.1 phage major capsid protein [Aneurinibacillus aneurinilyticus]MED0723084.1 phage major capsid protein [Aneurinibacillus aneurinilyticus]MED0731465.1 phage major capsid protein [Aneurinibacillus aneurinilyticus]MED0740088.1 phage major capsid protein [Aneurinibacillus aneurinilyticus]